MKPFSLLLAFTLVADCLGVEQKPPSTAQDQEPTYRETTVIEWTVVAKDKDPALRSHAAFMLGQIGPEAKVAVPILTELLADQDRKVRECAAYALGRIGPDAKPAVPVLMELLKDQDYLVRWNAVRALGSVGPGAKSAIPALVKLLDGKDRSLRVNVARTLGHIGADGNTTVRVLVELLRDRQVRGAAILALGDVERDAKAAIPALTALLGDPDPGIRLDVADALVKINPEAKDAAIQALAELTKDKRWWVRRGAAKSLGKIGSEAKTAIPILTQLLNDPEADVQKAASEALEKIRAKKTQPFRYRQDGGL